MKLQAISIKDRALDSFFRPVFVRSLGEAIRSFQDEINNPQSELNKHPDDYDLYHLGNFDDQNGRFENLLEPQQLAIGKQLMRSDDVQK